MTLLYELSAEQRELGDVVRRVLGDGRAARRPYDGGPPGPDLGLWRALVDLGVAGLGIEEDDGGSGGDAVDLLVVAEELGRAVAPVPFVANAAAAAGLAPAVADHPDRRRWLGALADGTAIGAVAYDNNGLVFDAAAASILLTADHGGIGVVEGPVLEPLPTVDRTRPVARWHRGDVRPTAVAGPPAVDAMRQLEQMLYAAEAVGVAADALGRTATHTRDRHQFGLPIGTFQAVKHRLADMLVDVESARSAVYAAGWALRNGASTESRIAVHMAQAVATEAVTRVVGGAIQLHGGIGVTWEHDLHLHLRRAKALELSCGTPAQHYDEIASTLLGPPRAASA